MYVRTGRKKLLEEGFMMLASGGCCSHGLLEGNMVMPPPQAFPESKGSMATVFSGRGGTSRELELAGFHLLSHVGGEVIGERGGNAVGGSRRWKGLEQLLWGRQELGICRSRVPDSPPGAEAGGHRGRCSVS